MALSILALFPPLFSALKHVRCCPIIWGKLHGRGGHWREEGPRLLSPRHQVWRLAAQVPPHKTSVRPKSARVPQLLGGFSIEVTRGAHQPVMPFQRQVAASPPQHVCAHSLACASCLQAWPSWAHGGTPRSGLMGFRKERVVGRAGVAQ